jgi:hypothetical protein
MYSQLYILWPGFCPGGQECISPTVLKEMTYCGGRIYEAVFALFSIEREATLAKQLIIMDVILFVSASYL